MRRLSLCLAVAVAALVSAPAALASGPSFVTEGGAGVASHNGAFHYVAVSDGNGATLLEKVAGGQVNYWVRLKGSWGTPTLGVGAGSGQGLSHDGRTLVLASTPGPPYASPSRFLLVDLHRMRVIRTITLEGYFSFDALSPDMSRMYLIQFEPRQAGDTTHYIVRGYDLRANRLLPGRIADRSEQEESMAGYALTRTTSRNGRWVYTLFQKPSGEPFIHALDTVGAAAHCIDLPKAPGLYNMVLSLRNHGRTLAAHWRSGRPWLNVAVGSWEISYPHAAFPWAYIQTAIRGSVGIKPGHSLLGGG